MKCAGCWQRSGAHAALGPGQEDSVRLAFLKHHSEKTGCSRHCNYTDS